MMDAVKAALLGLGVAEANIKTEAFGTIKRDPSARGAASSEIAGRVFFQASDTSAPATIDATILEAADQAGVLRTFAERYSPSCLTLSPLPASGLVRDFAHEIFLRVHPLALK
jgi:hypothetical protein